MIKSVIIRQGNDLVLRVKQLKDGQIEAYGKKNTLQFLKITVMTDKNERIVLR